MLFKGDRWILYTVFFLMLLSTLSVYSSVSALAYQKASGDTTLFLMGHCGKLLVSLVLLCVTSRIKPKYYSGLAELSLIMSIVLLLLTFVVGTNINGSSRWLSIGGLTFQPSELVKISLILYVAKELARNFETPDKAFWRITAVAGITCMVIALENLSTSLLIAMTIGTLMIIGRISLWRIGAVGMALAAFVFVAVYFAPQVGTVFERAETWRARIERFMGDGEAQDNYQAEQAITAVSTGGLTGRGPGNSYMKNFLPMAFSDFIFSIILEEYGLLGCVAVIVAFFIIMARSCHVGRRCKKPFHLYTIMGLAVCISYQALINMMVGVGLMPVTGQTLPMVSMGGTSNMIMGIAFGIMLSVSEETRLLNAEGETRPLEDIKKYIDSLREKKRQKSKQKA